MSGPMLDDDQQKAVDKEKINVFLDNLFAQGDRNWNGYPEQVADIFNYDKEESIEFVRSWLKERGFIR